MYIIVSDFSPFLEPSVVVGIVISVVIFRDCFPLVNFDFHPSIQKILLETYMHPFFKSKTEVILDVEVNISHILANKRFEDKSQHWITHDDVICWNFYSGVTIFCDVRQILMIADQKMIDHLFTRQVPFKMPTEAQMRAHESLYRATSGPQPISSYNTYSAHSFASISTNLRPTLNIYANARGDLTYEPDAR